MDAFRVSGAGNVPEVNCQVYGPVPPLAPSVCAYATPAVPFGSDAVVRSSGGARVRGRLAVAVCCGDPEWATLKVSGVAVTAAVGVPPIVPVDAFRVSPAGNTPAVSCQVR